MKLLPVLCAVLSMSTLATSLHIPAPFAPRTRAAARSLPTYAPVPHRTTPGSAILEPDEQSLRARQSNQQIPFQFCPEFFGRDPKLCSDCGGDSRVPGVCDKILVSGPQSNCPPGGPYDSCSGYFCKCSPDGTDNSPKVTSTTVIDGATGIVVWEPMTLTQYAILRSKTTVTLTEAASATTENGELETVVAAVFAGGIAWWVASQSGAVGAALAIQPPSQPPDGSKQDDKICPSNPKEDCKNCGGADEVGLCKSGTEAGCPCDEVQRCPNELPRCSDSACGGDNGQSQCSASGEIKGCLCCPDKPPVCSNNECKGDASSTCQTDKIKGCTCIQVFDGAPLNIALYNPQLPSEKDLSSIAARIFTTAWSADYKSIPGFTTTAATPTSCKFVTTVFPSDQQSIAGSGTQTFCTCDSTIVAGINYATSDTATTSWCAFGQPVPSGYTQIPVCNGGGPCSTSASTTMPMTTKTTTVSTTTPKTTSCNFNWCGAPYCFPTCGPAN